MGYEQLSSPDTRLRDGSLRNGVKGSFGLCQGRLLNEQILGPHLRSSPHHPLSAYKVHNDHL
jgi:hypothetical protein